MGEYVATHESITGEYGAPGDEIKDTSGASEAAHEVEAFRAAESTETPSDTAEEGESSVEAGERVWGAFKNKVSKGTNVAADIAKKLSRFGLRCLAPNLFFREIREAGKAQYKRVSGAVSGKAGEIKGRFEELKIEFDRKLDETATKALSTIDTKSRQAEKAIGEVVTTIKNDAIRAWTNNVLEPIKNGREMIRAIEAWDKLRKIRALEAQSQLIQTQIDALKAKLRDPKTGEKVFKPKSGGAFDPKFELGRLYRESGADATT